MKKIAIALMCTILATGAAMAQKQFTFGPKIGVDYTHYWGEDVNHGGQLNYQAGLFMEYRFTNKFSIAPEVVFAAQGGKSGNNTIHVNYVNIPLMFKFYVAPAFSIDLGPQLGINVYSKYTPKGGTAQDINYAKDVDFGVGLGATYNIASDVFVQARYTMGMTKAFKVGHKQKNGNAQIAIGYRF